MSYIVTAWSYNERHDELCHYGVPGQKKGYRRYQNEDGSYTEEGRRHYGIGEGRQATGQEPSDGKERFYSKMTDRQRRQYDRQPEKWQRSIEKKMDKGLSYMQAVSSYAEDRKRKVELIVSLTAMGLIYASNPLARYAMRSIGKYGIKAIARGLGKIKTAAINSNIAKAGKMFIDRMKKRRALIKDGAITLKKSQFDIRETVIPFGGFLKG